MYRFFWLFVVWMCVATNASQSIDPYEDIEYYRLDNGLQVYLLSDDRAVNTQISLEVRVGYGVENDRTYGLTHLVEHMVFRDQRVPHHDYLDYIKDEGGTYINGYTKKYQTAYLATIDSNKSYWIANTFADMIFDKNVTDEDITIEKGALQTEIGEPHWYYKLFWNIGKFFEKITPPEENLYHEEFSLTKAEELPARYHAQENNKRFTLDEVMQHYNAYYYPSNMTLTIVGNFSVEKMKSLIDQKYGHVKKHGTKFAKKPPRDAKLNNKPYHRFYEGAGENSAFIGAKYIIDDYKKYLILDIYTNNLAQRLQQYIRNQLGKTYSINAYDFSDRDAGIMTINFDSLHDDFQENIDRVKKEIFTNMIDINESTISNSFRMYEQNYYASIEHDSDSLISLVETAKYLRNDMNITDRSSYEIFKSITHQEFRDTIIEVFTPENSYMLIYRDHYFFPMELPLLSILSIILFIFVYTRLYRIGIKKAHMAYTHRDILMHRRVSNRFIGFLLLVVTILISSIVLDWIKYLLLDALLNDPYYLLTIDVPYSYLATIADPILYLIVFVILYFYLWRYYARIDVTKDAIFAIGNRVMIFKKEEILDISVTPWSLGYYRDTIGSGIFFWRPLVRIVMRDGYIKYIRASNATHLAEDISKWLES